MNFILIGELFDNYVIAVDKGLAPFLLIGYLALLGSIPYLANIKQPVPHWVSN